MASTALEFTASELTKWGSTLFAIVAHCLMLCQGHPENVAALLERAKLRQPPGSAKRWLEEHPPKRVSFGKAKGLRPKNLGSLSVEKGKRKGTY